MAPKSSGAFPRPSRSNAALAGVLLLAACGGPDTIVEPPHVARLAFRTHPAVEEGQVPFDPAIVVELQDASGAIVAGASQSVSLRLASNSVGATLSGTTTAVAVGGIATFANVYAGAPGEGFVLEAVLDGVPTASGSPFAVRLSLSTISVGGSHSCALTTVGYAYCWGGNAAGQLGDSTTALRVRPTPVAGHRRYDQLSTGDQHTCAVTPDHVAYCWGLNVYGRLGDGTTEAQRATPTLVAEGLAFKQISAGANHTCGVTVAGDPYCWGFNDYGQVGDSQIGQYRAPIPVTGTVQFVRVSAGTTHTCGLTADSVGYCWGNNDVGQLGDTTTVSSAAPTPVAGGLRFLRLAAGGIHTCGVTAAHALYCWGFNNHGQVGDGTLDERHAPTLIMNGTSVEDVSTGYMYTCAVATGGAAYCWGINFDGQVGDSTYLSPRKSPTAVVGGLAFTRVAAHATHTCGLTVASVAYCWGIGIALGDGTDQSKFWPTRVIQ